MAIYSGISHYKWRFPIVMLVYQRVPLVNVDIANWNITIFKFGKSIVSMGHLQWQTLSHDQRVNHWSSRRALQNSSTVHLMALSHSHCIPTYPNVSMYHEMSINTYIYTYIHKYIYIYYRIGIYPIKYAITSQ